MNALIWGCSRNKRATRWGTANRTNASANTRKTPCNWQLPRNCLSKGSGGRSHRRISCTGDNDDLLVCGLKRIQSKLNEDCVSEEFPKLYAISLVCCRLSLIFWGIRSLGLWPWGICWPPSTIPKMHLRICLCEEPALLVLTIWCFALLSSEKS